MSNSGARWRSRLTRALPLQARAAASDTSCTQGQAQIATVRAPRARDGRRRCSGAARRAAAPRALDLVLCLAPPYAHRRCTRRLARRCCHAKQLPLQLCAPLRGFPRHSVGPVALDCADASPRFSAAQLEQQIGATQEQASACAAGGQLLPYNDMWAPWPVHAWPMAETGKCGKMKAHATYIQTQNQAQITTIQNAMNAAGC